MISDVTITYNNVEGLKRTLNSFLVQISNNYEVIVIDGGSIDGTMEVLLEYERIFGDKGINYTYISEPDNGRYDAMNKGIRLASGEWIAFINAGDRLTSPETLLEIDKRLANTEADIVYGDNNRCFKDKTEYSKASKSLDGIERGLPFNHQSVFTKTCLFKKREYDSLLKISGDYEWFLAAYIEGRSFEYVDICVSDFYMDGISSYKKLDTYKEAIIIRKKHGVEDKWLVKKIKFIVWWIIDKINRTAKS